MQKVLQALTCQCYINGELYAGGELPPLSEGQKVVVRFPRGSYYEKLKPQDSVNLPPDSAMQIPHFFGGMP